MSSSVPRRLLGLSLFAVATAQGQVGRIWLTHQSEDPGRIVINWESTRPAPSVVRFGTTPQLGSTATVGDAATLHHVGIALPEKDVIWHYVVGDGAEASAMASFKGCPSDVFRAVIVGDWHGNANPSAAAILRDDPHLLLTAGDNVPSLHEKGREGAKAFGALIDSAPELFCRIAMLPVVGNHDKEAHPRGPKPPAEPVYDVDAKAFREFFPLPGDQWKWSFDVPDFDARFIALDLQHISDFGTTWQTCHAFAPGSPQFEWYRQTVAETRAGFVFTIHNERNATMRGQANGAWDKLFRMGSALVTGFGQYAERAEVDDFPCFNTHAHGGGPVYADPRAVFSSKEGSYLLLAFKRGDGTMTVQIKNQRGDVLDTRVVPKRAR